MSDLAPALPRVAFYVGGFASIGGIESCFEDLAMALSGAPIDLSLFVWADALPQLDAIERSGTRVRRTALRSGCRFGLPDAALFVRHGAKLRGMDKIVFGKIPPEAVLRRMVAMLDARPGGRPELLYVTPYRPAELWPGGVLPPIVAEIDTMIVQGAAFADDLRDMGFAGRIVELPYLPPIAAPVPRNTPRNGVCRLGFLGRFVPQKNLLYLLDIVAMLRDERIELHLFGEGPQEPALRAEVAARALPVTVHGPLARADVPAAIERCDMFLNPSISEGQCLVALEVLSRGRPFLASAVGAIPQILARAPTDAPFGAIVPLGDAPAAAEIVRSAIMRWRAGGWNSERIVVDYARAYAPDAVLARYVELFTQPVRRDRMSGGAA